MEKAQKKNRSRCPITTMAAAANTGTAWSFARSTVGISASSTLRTMPAAIPVGAPSAVDITRLGPKDNAFEAPATAKSASAPPRRKSGSDSTSDDQGREKERDHIGDEQFRAHEDQLKSTRYGIMRFGGQETELDRMPGIALSVGPGVVDRFDNVARSQGDIACDILDLDGPRAESTVAVKVFRAFQVEPFSLAQIHPGENTTPDLCPITPNRRCRPASGVVDQRGVLVRVHHATAETAAS